MNIQTRTYTREDVDAMLGTLPATSTGQVTACPQGFEEHRLRPGETLRSLAQSCGLTMNELLLYNPHINPYHYKSGDTVCLPAADSADDTAQADTTAMDTPAEESVSAAETADAQPQTDESAAVADEAAEDTQPAEQPAESADDAPCPCEDGRLYRVVSGDTLYKIAKRNAIPLEQLTRANPGASSGQLAIGQLLCIPAAKECTRVRVPAGAAFEDFLLRYDLSFATLRAANPDTDLLALQEGQVLCVPQKGGCSLCSGRGSEYTIAQGETLSSLAENSGLSVRQLLAANPCLTPSDFAAGRKVCLPET